VRCPIHTSNADAIQHYRQALDALAASLGEMSLAIWNGVVPAGTSFTDPSGK